MITLLIAGGLIALAAFIHFGNGRELAWRLVAGNPDLGQFDLADPARSPNPNDALYCTPGLCTGVKVSRELPQYDETPEKLIARILEEFEASGEIMQRVDDGAEPAWLRVVTWTPGFRFPDTNSFQAAALDNGRTGLVAYARAQLGTSDGRNNARRLKQITAALQ